MKVIYNATETTWPADIVDDDDVRAFIFENLSRSWKIPLCVTLKQKVFSSEDNDDPLQTGLNFVTQGDLEDIVLHDSDNDLVNQEVENASYHEEFENLPNMESDNVFQDSVEFNELPHEGMVCDVVPANVQFDEPSSNRSNVHKGTNIVHESDKADLYNSDGDIVVGQLYETKEDLKKS
ncbi:hypothetical protein EV1_026360 [Malus domestica]